MELISLAIFTASLLCILLRPWGMPEWVAALAGSAAMLVTRGVAPADAGIVLRDNLPV